MLLCHSSRNSQRYGVIGGYDKVVTDLVVFKVVPVVLEPLSNDVENSGRGQW